MQQYRWFDLQYRPRWPTQNASLGAGAGVLQKCGCRGSPEVFVQALKQLCPNAPGSTGGTGFCYHSLRFLCNTWRASSLSIQLANTNWGSRGGAPTPPEETASDLIESLGINLGSPGHMWPQSGGKPTEQTPSTKEHLKLCMSPSNLFDVLLSSFGLFDICS